MKLIRRTIITVFVVIVTALSSLAAPAAYAATDYDDLIKTTPSLYVYTDGNTKTAKMNLGDTWWTELKQPYEKRLANTPVGFNPDFVDVFDEIVTTGGSYMVILKDHPAGKMLELYGTTDPNAYCYFEGSAPYHTFRCNMASGYEYAYADYITHNTFGGNSCAGDTCSDNGINIYASPYVGASWDGTFLAYSPYEVADREFYYSTFDITYPVGYEGEIIPTEPPLEEYVAMGDSFSSGEGVEPFLAGTNRADDTGTVGVNEENRCHRSNNAYPKLLQRDVDFNYSLKFVACSGATTSNITTSGQWGEPAQMDALSETTDVVTLTIGGNDVGFTEFAKKCVSPLNMFVLDEVCDEYTDAYDSITGAIEDELPAKLESTYTLILDEAPNAEIYVLGYPVLAPYKSITDPFDNDCGGLYDEIPNNWGDARAAHDVVTMLNSTIDNAIESVKVAESTTRIHFVDVSSGSFVGHDVCSSNSYFNGIDVFNPEYSIHPNTNGQKAYKEDLAEEIN